MQVSAFMPLLRKYKDYDSSPACETQERITEKFGEPTTYFLILCDDKRVGALRVVRIDEASCRIAPVFIIPQYQKKGIAQKVFALLEQEYPNVMLWKLDTILQEKGIAICTKSSVIIKPEKSITRMMCWTSCIMKRCVKINF